MKNFNFSWLERLGKVILIFLFIVIIPISFFIGSDISYYGKYSASFLYGALFVFGYYVFLILITKTILYVFKGENFIKSGFRKGHYLLLSAPIALFVLAGIVFAVAIEPMQEEMEARERASEYLEATQNIDRLSDELRECFAPYRDEYVEAQTRECNLRRGSIKSDYDFCVSLYIKSPTACLYENDYESVDCSTEKIGKDVTNQLLFSGKCEEEVDKWLEARHIITSYEEAN